MKRLYFGVAILKAVDPVRGGHKIDVCTGTYLVELAETAKGTLFAFARDWRPNAEVMDVIINLVPDEAVIQAMAELRAERAAQNSGGE